MPHSPEIAALVLAAACAIFGRRIRDLIEQFTPRPPGPPSHPLPGDDVWVTLRRKLRAERVHFKRPA